VKCVAAAATPDSASWLGEFLAAADGALFRHPHARQGLATGTWRFQHGFQLVCKWFQLVLFNMHRPTTVHVVLATSFYAL